MVKFVHITLKELQRYKKNYHVISFFEHFFSYFPFFFRESREPDATETINDI